MSDPLSVAGSAVGIMSLGIQVFEKLLQYYDAWKEAPQDILTIRSSIKQLLDILHLLREHLSRSDVSPEAVWLSLQSLELCEDSIGQLQIALDSADAPEKTIKAHLKRLQWPFKRQTIQSLQRTTNTLRSNLQLALQTFQISGLGDLDRKLQTVLKISLSREDKEVLSWLSPLKPFETQSNTMRRSQPNSGDWLVETQEYKDWVNGDIKNLWCRGMRA